MDIVYNQNTGLNFVIKISDSRYSVNSISIHLGKEITPTKHKSFTLDKY